MLVQHLKNSTEFRSTYLIFISRFTAQEKEGIIKTLKRYKVRSLMSNDLISISCDDEATFNWLLLEYLDTTDK